MKNSTYDEKRKSIQKSLYGDLSGEKITIPIGIVALVVALFVMAVFKEQCLTIQKQWLSTIYNLALTLSTILTAVMVLFYTLENQKRYGHTYRDIVANSLGSWRFNGIYIVSMVALFLCACFSSVFTNFYVAGLIIFQIEMQFYIFVMILLHSSSIVCAKIIVDMEQRRYQYLKDNNWEVERIYPELSRHIDQIIHGEESLPEKIPLLRAALCTPFLSDPKEPKWHKINLRNIVDPSRFSLESAKLKDIYSYYYINLLDCFNALEKENKREDRNTFYRMLYEYAEYVLSVHEQSYQIVDVEQAAENRKKVLMLAIAMIHAALVNEYGKNDEMGEFCVVLLNNLQRPKNSISKNDEDFNQYLLVLFLLSLEYLDRIIPDGMPYIYYEKIDGLDLWNYETISDTQEDICVLFWSMWMQMESVDPIHMLRYLNNALGSLRKESQKSDILTEVFFRISHRKGVKWVE